MCLQAILLGRMARTNFKFSSIGTGSTEFIPPNQNRISLLLSSHKVNDISIQFESEATAVQSILIPANTSPVKLNIEEYGDLLTKALLATSSPGASTTG